MADVIKVKTLVRSSWALWVALDPVTGVLMRLRGGRLVSPRGRVKTGCYWPDTATGPGRSGATRSRVSHRRACPGAARERGSAPTSDLQPLLCVATCYGDQGRPCEGRGLRALAPRAGHSVPSRYVYEVQSLIEPGGRFGRLGVGRGGCTRTW